MARVPEVVIRSVNSKWVQKGPVVGEVGEVKASAPLTSNSSSLRLRPESVPFLLLRMSVCSPNIYFCALSSRFMRSTCHGYFKKRLWALEVRSTSTPRTAAAHAPINRVSEYYQIRCCLVSSHLLPLPARTQSIQLIALGFGRPRPNGAVTRRSE